MFDTVRLYDAQLRELLGGETPLVAVSFQVAFGADRTERSPEEVEQLLRFLPRGVREQALELRRNPPAAPDRRGWRAALDRVIDGFTGDLINGDPDSWIGGVTATGHVGSWARHLQQALDRAVMAYCVVSDSRLVFAEHEVGGPFHELAALPREAVLRARRSGRVLQRGRVVLDFADLSALALTTGMLSARHANQLVSVLGGGVVREND